MAISSGEFLKIEEIVSRTVSNAVDPVKKDVGELKSQMSSLVDDVDHFLRIVRNHDQEWLIVRAQHQKIRDVLVKKGIATEEELSVA